VPTDDMAHAQEIQLAIDHYVCGVIEGEIAGEGLGARG
jgi:hypothetical protein